MKRVQKHNSLTVFALAVAALLTAQIAHAASYEYSGHQRTINAGIILLDDKDATGAIISGMGDTQIAQGASNPDPYVFYILSQRPDVLPRGWNIVNPLAPGTVTNSILTRWDARCGGNGNSGYQVNQPIRPYMAPYWEVPLAEQTDPNVLLQFDVLLLNLQAFPGGSTRTVRLTSTEAEMLRRFVDGGGQLWVEDSGGGNMMGPGGQVADPLFLNFTFNGASPGTATLPFAVGAPVLLRHPIIDAPYQLTQTDLNTLAAHTTADITSPDPSLLSAVAANSNTGSLPIIAASQIGAGQIIVTATASSAYINSAVGGTNPGGFGPNSGPVCGQNYKAAPTVDLEFVTDLLSWDTAHPNEVKTSHQSSQSRSNLGAAVTPLWSYTITAASAVTTYAPSAAINGDYVYARGADGILHAFNGTPGTDILESQTGITDSGILDNIYGAPYDEIWNSGTGAYSTSPLSLPASGLLSAPTLAAIPGSGQTLVFVEAPNGIVHAADAITGTVYSGGNVTGGVLPVASPGTVTYITAAPSPTYYGGRIYASQGDGSLYVYDFNGGSAHTGLRYQVTASTTGEPIAAAPTIGIMRDTANGTSVDDIVAALSTTMGVYTVLLGARHDNIPAPAGNLTPVYAGAAATTQFTIDAGAPSYIYNNNAYGYPAQASSPYTLPNYLGNYDVDFTSPANSLSRAEFTANPPLPGGYTTPPAASAATISAPALGSNGNLYYTANLPVTVTLNGASVQTTDSTLVCARDMRANSSNRINWRFRLPYAGETPTVDADGISDGPLSGFQFHGTPVVDGSGNVFALATNGTQTAILCFNGTQAVTVQAVPAAAIPAGDTVNLTGMTQMLPGGTTDEFGGTPPQTIQTGSQYNTAVDSNDDPTTLTNFGVGSGSPGVISPNFAEPQPVTVNYSLTYTDPVSGQSISQPEVTPEAPMHTNLLWYALLPDAAFVPAGISASQATSSPTLVGNYLYYGDNSGNVYRLYAYPQDSGLVGAGRAVNIGTLASPALDNSGHPAFASAQTNVGAISAAPSASGDLLVVNGAAGVVALGSRYTLVADSNRILEADADGAASWAVDATTETTTAGTRTHLELNHPSSLFQMAANDYLVADTGNNRCVRFNRSGQVLWELTRFNDSAHLLTPGEATTLSHPTSVQIKQITLHDNSTPPNVTGQIFHYLIADTGNYRVLDVVDQYDANGNPVSGQQHNLVWVSHTYDVQHRRYQYTNASYFTGPDGNNYVAALIANARLKTPLPAAPGQLNAATTDAPGSSLVLLSYNPSATTGLVAAAASSFYAYIQPNGQFDINDAPKQLAGGGRSTAAATPTGTFMPVYLRNPRFLQTYTPPGSTSASPELQNFLLADDNGVFDLVLDTSVTPHRFEAQWGYTPADYQATHAGLRFLPSSLQRVSTELITPTPASGNPYITYLMGHYIVANGYSQGEVTPISGFGGEVLELNSNSATLATQVYSSFSRLGNTAPLSQPAFAVREK